MKLNLLWRLPNKIVKIAIENILILYNIIGFYDNLLLYGLFFLLLSE
jgi:hypothetical protein